MNNQKTKTKTVLIAGFLALVGVGTHNALMIQSNSSLGQAASIKRLDEMNGVVIHGRTIAVEKKWQKIPAIKTAKVESQNSPSVVANGTSETPVLQGALELKLAEVINPKKWQQPLNPAQFSGSVVANDGIIESLNVSLPGMDSVTVSFTEMAGNVFEYDYAGEVYSGLMYQVDQSSYMVTLTNGPLEGTRMRFQGQSTAPEQTQQFLAEVHQVEVGSFGSDELSESPMGNNEESIHAAGFNFEAKQI
jgi:RNA recognition motif-containing protein